MGEDETFAPTTRAATQHLTACFCECESERWGGVGRGGGGGWRGERDTHAHGRDGEGGGETRHANENVDFPQIIAGYIKLQRQKILCGLDLLAHQVELRYEGVELLQRESE